MTKQRHWGFVRRCGRWLVSCELTILTVDIKRELSYVVGSLSRETTLCDARLPFLFLFYPLSLPTPRPTASSSRVGKYRCTWYITLTPRSSLFTLLPSSRKPCHAISSMPTKQRVPTGAPEPPTPLYGLTPASPSSTMIFLTLAPWLST